MNERESVKYLKVLQQQFAHAAGMVVGEDPLDVTPMALKTRAALQASVAGDYPAALQAVTELRAMLIENMGQRSEQRGEKLLLGARKSGDPLSTQFRHLQAISELVYDVQQFLRREESTDALMKADPAALLQAAQKTNAAPEVKALLLCAARNMVRQDEKLRDMSREIDGLKQRLNDKDAPKIMLDKKRILPGRM